MYVGALYPALLLIALYCVYIFIVSIVRPQAVPALPKEARTLGSGVTSLFVMIATTVALYYLAKLVLFTGIASPEWRLVAALGFAVAISYGVALANSRFKLNLISRLAEQVIIVLVPPLTLIFLVLGTIFLGIATPTEGGAMGATGALALALAKGRLSFSSLKSALEATTKLSAFVMMILIGARVFGLTFYGINGNVWIEDLLLALPGGETGFLIVVTIIIFVLACFLDYFEIAFIMVPLLMPVAQSLGIDLVWFGIIISVNLQTSFLTPPFGFSLFFLRSIAPANSWLDKVTGKKIAGIKTAEIYRGAIPFIIIQIIVIFAVIFFPGLVMHYKSDQPLVDTSTIQIEIPGGPGTGGMGLPPLGGSGGAPNLGLPPLNLGGPGGSSTPAQPSFGLPPLNLGGEAPAQPAAPAAPAGQPDLSQPPTF
jgi:TRAP-type mannitol/chloroaromatic compound transport system permease large subunit